MSYQTQGYADSLAEFGTPRWLPNCRGWVLQREIPGVSTPVKPANGATDAMGCYPLFVCEDWARLGADLAELRDSGIITLTVVTDPLGQADPEQLQAWFTPVARPYKEHYLVDLSLGTDEVGSAHHRRNVRRFLGRGRIEVCDHPAAELDCWSALYDQLIAHHGITGIARFSRESFRRQLALPGVTLLRAVTHAGEVAGMQFWASDGDKAWYHLGAYNELGYRLGGASSALTAFALDHFRQHGVRRVNLGSGAGLSHDAQDGLSRFKRGWATETRRAWLCGIVLNPEAYKKICLSGGSHAETGYFPAYRMPRPVLAAEPEVTVHAHAD